MNETLMMGVLKVTEHLILLTMLEIDCQIFFIRIPPPITQFCSFAFFLSESLGSGRLGREKSLTQYHYKF